MIRYKFFTEDGTFDLTYHEYLQNHDLRRKVLSVRRANLFLGLKILSFDRDWLDQHPDAKEYYEFWENEYKQCPIRFFLPNCCGYDNFEDSPAHKYINDDSHEFVSALAGNRVGKSTLMWAKMLLRCGFIKTDPSWECFTDHGVEYVLFTGARKVMFVTYEFIGHRTTLWPEVVRKWTPRAELGDKADWDFPKRTDGEIIKMAESGSTVAFHTLEQSQPFESTVYDDVLWDEQGVDVKVEGAEARMRTRRRYEGKKIVCGRHLSAATPHKVKGRPDTGAGTWFHRMYKGEETRGLNSKFYEMDIFKTSPDWIYPEAEKERQMVAIEEARRVNNMKRLRELESRAYGTFEWSGGLVYDDYDPEVHIIDDFPIPDDWCMIRAGDHGRVTECAWIWMAISPDNEWFFCRDFVSSGETIDEVCNQVIQRSGNKKVESGTIKRGRWIGSRYKEEFIDENYLYSKLDSRSFSAKDQDSHTNIGDIYHADGLHTLTRAVGKELNFGIEILREALKPDYNEINPYTGLKGRPHCYIFKSCKAIIRNIGEYRNVESRDENKNPIEKPQQKNDHIPDAMRFGVSNVPHHNRFKTVRPPAAARAKSGVLGRGYWCDEDKEHKNKNRRSVRDHYTGG